MLKAAFSGLVRLPRLRGASIRAATVNVLPVVDGRRPVAAGLRRLAAALATTRLARTTAENATATLTVIDATGTAAGALIIGMSIFHPNRRTLER
jgi:hypothetical protein